jgi:hypothetical protein
MVTCRFCKIQLTSQRELRFHCEFEHQAEYLKVQIWLGKTTQLRLASYERLAKQGMVGHKEVNNR